VPNDFKLDNDQETLVIEVVYNTQVLYGTVKGQRTITVYR